MQITSTLEHYQQALEQGEIQPDEVQQAAIIHLNDIQQHLLRQALLPSPESGRSLAGWTRRFFRSKKLLSTEPPIKGLYMWGGVGRGKTWLMDLFFQSVAGEKKLRLHFHRFMLRVHEELNQLQGQSDPLQTIADRFKAQADLLCFDEFFVSDITDAMLLGTLMEALFARGVTLVATSNIPPDELYRNGLQRSRFLPAIEQIKQHCDVMNVDAGIDYRLRTLTEAHLWLTPPDDVASARMDRIFSTLAGEARYHKPVLNINYRSIPTQGVAGGVLAIDFSTLCGEGRSQNDYIAIARQFHSVLLFDVPVLDGRAENAARRFLALVDEFYERNVKLIISSQTSLSEVYQGSLLTFEYQRCYSRLKEMQSEEYLRLKHLTDTPAEDSVGSDRKKVDL